MHIQAPRGPGWSVQKGRRQGPHTHLRPGTAQTVPRPALGSSQALACATGGGGTGGFQLPPYPLLPVSLPHSPPTSQSILSLPQDLGPCCRSDSRVPALPNRYLWALNLRPSSSPHPLQISPVELHRSLFHSGPHEGREVSQCRSRSWKVAVPGALCSTRVWSLGPTG